MTYLISVYLHLPRPSFRPKRIERATFDAFLLWEKVIYELGQKQFIVIGTMGIQSSNYK